MNSSSVSIIIPTYNRPASLRKTLESILKLTPPPLEVLILDQSDPPAADFKEWITEICHRHKRLHWLHHSPPNAQVARNRGIREARGDILLFLDDDVEVAVDLVEKHALDYRDQSVAAVAGMILERQEEPTCEIPERCFIPKIGWMYFPLNYALPAEVINLSSCNCSVRREHALAIGGFDENFIRTLFDDSDFSWRLHKYAQPRGLRVIHDPDAQLTHFRTPSGGNRPGKYNQHVVGDAACWYTWCYFLFQHWGWSAFAVLAKRYRWWIWHRKNIIRPWWLLAAHWAMMKGVSRAYRAMQNGSRLMKSMESESE